MEFSKSDYFQKLNINENIYDISSWRPMTQDVELPIILKYYAVSVLVLQVVASGYEDLLFVAT